MLASHDIVISTVVPKLPLRHEHDWWTDSIIAVYISARPILLAPAFVEADRRQRVNHAASGGQRDRPPGGAR
jgi:hypothetical protein